ncbi:TIM barrel protein [Planosporangium flavigriseum]|uniref:Inosose dehydratase n=1 Tax=Planosporangium flavigriseum TaxID=373681 RepID=A0A8J3LRK0_9ACTN|nr:sugar phosphate isomerase/epimerase [Planosporangium flavigriseum]NJC67886.1 TIM barrel protein [Planosporangium flavigriseum]GIG76732.1 inosose dehydratase [Planosporangium flavigriseum]
MRLGYHSITWGGVVGEPTGVTSVKDLFYRANGDMQRALRDIAAEGYQGVELFDGNVADFADRPEVLRELLHETGLTLVSVYTGANFIYADSLPDELWRVNRAAELAALFGAEKLVVGGGARRAAGTDDEDYDRLGKSLDTVVDIAERQGLNASYHPHLSTIVESPDELERIMTRSRIGFCPDTAHLAAGGGDPAALIRQYPERIEHVHLKDYRPEPFAFLPLGQGALDFPDILAAVQEAGYDGWLLVELDSYDGDPREAARISKAYLDALLDSSVSR